MEGELLATAEEVAERACELFTFLLGNDADLPPEAAARISRALRQCREALLTCECELADSDATAEG